VKDAERKTDIFLPGDFALSDAWIFWAGWLSFLFHGHNGASGKLVWSHLTNHNQTEQIKANSHFPSCPIQYFRTNNSRSHLSTWGHRVHSSVPDSKTGGKTKQHIHSSLYSNALYNDVWLIQPTRFKS